MIYLKRFSKQRKKFSTQLKNEKPNCVNLACVSANLLIYAINNPYCFTNWLCGGGIKGGATGGLSDEFGYKPQDRNNPTEVYDIHATIMHLLGINHEKLTFRANGVDRRLTDVHGHVLRDLLA